MLILFSKELVKLWAVWLYLTTISILFWDRWSMCHDVNSSSVLQHLCPKYLKETSLWKTGASQATLVELPRWLWPPTLSSFSFAHPDFASYPYERWACVIWLMLFCACWGWCIGSPIDWFASSVYCRGRDTNVGLCIQQQNKNICKVFWYTFSYKLLHTIQTGDLLKSIGQSKKCYYELKPVVYHSCTEWSMIEKNNR
jgi:hypothetical protein